MSYSDQVILIHDDWVPSNDLYYYCRMDIDTTLEEERQKPYCLPTDIFLNICVCYGVEPNEHDIYLIMQQEEEIGLDFNPLITSTREEMTLAFNDEKRPRLSDAATEVLQRQAAIISKMSLTKPIRDAMRSFFTAFNGRRKIWYARYDR